MTTRAPHWPSGTSRKDRLSLTDISYQLGFAAPSAFSRWFRDRFGISPTEWRRSAAAPRPGAGGSVLAGDR